MWLGMKKRGKMTGALWRSGMWMFPHLTSLMRTVTDCDKRHMQGFSVHTFFFGSGCAVACQVASQPALGNPSPFPREIISTEASVKPALLHCKCVEQSLTSLTLAAPAWLLGDQQASSPTVLHNWLSGRWHLSINPRWQARWVNYQVTCPSTWHARSIWRARSAPDNWPGSFTSTIQKPPMHSKFDQKQSDWLV